MYKTITATQISRKAGLTIPPPGLRCFVNINYTKRLEMVHTHMKTKPGGIVWFFICPVTGKRCRKLHLINGRYIHSSIIKGYHRNIKPLWYSGTLMDNLLKKVQRKINAEKTIESKHFKAYYNGKPTKKYLKCLNQIKAGGNVSMMDIINGTYNNLLRKPSI